MAGGFTAGPVQTVLDAGKGFPMLLSWFLNGIYGLVLLIASPWLIWRSLRTGRYRQGLSDKLFGLTQPPLSLSAGTRPIWFHGVSVGEIHLLRQVIQAFRQRHPNIPVVVSSTTDTGLAEARKAFADLTVIVFPFDFSWAVNRTIAQINPGLVVLAEGDLWPNLLLSARRRGVAVAVINARMSPRSFERYRRFSFLTRRLLGLVSLYLTQDERHADNLLRLGVAPDRVFATGSVKFDGSSQNRTSPATLALGELLQVHPEDVIWIAGSTQSPEEAILLRCYAILRHRCPRLRLILVPRHPERFAEVATLLNKLGLHYSRRSQLKPSSRATPVVLMDSMGELGAAWGLAQLAYVGGSLDGKRGGQNMIEPAGYGVPVLFGPHVWNFRETARRLVEIGGARQVANEAELLQAAGELLGNADLRHQMGETAQRFVLNQQGATARTLDRLAPWLSQPSNPSKAA